MTHIVGSKNLDALTGEAYTAVDSYLKGAGGTLVYRDPKSGQWIQPGSTSKYGPVPAGMGGATYTFGKSTYLQVFWDLLSGKITRIVEFGAGKNFVQMVGAKSLDGIKKPPALQASHYSEVFQKSADFVTLGGFSVTKTAIQKHDHPHSKKAQNAFKKAAISSAVKAATFFAGPAFEGASEAGEAAQATASEGSAVADFGTDFDDAIGEGSNAFESFDYSSGEGLTAFSDASNVDYGFGAFPDAGTDAFGDGTTFLDDGIDFGTTPDPSTGFGTLPDTSWAGDEGSDGGMDGWALAKEVGTGVAKTALNQYINKITSGGGGAAKNAQSHQTVAHVVTKTPGVGSGAAVQPSQGVGLLSQIETAVKRTFTGQLKPNDGSASPIATSAHVPWLVIGIALISAAVILKGKVEL